MGWRDNLLEASLDGVPFLYRSVTTSVGRRTVEHEFAGRDDPFAEDMGRHADHHKIQAFVLGENYATARDDLMGVIRAGGDHSFSHPYLGLFTVKILGRVDITESDSEGRMARFDITMVESGFAFPLIAIDTVAALGYAADAVLEKLSTKTKFNLLKAIGAVLNSIANGLNAAASAMRKLNGKISAGLGKIDNITSAIKAFQSEMLTLMNSPQALMNKLTALSTAAFSLIKEFTPPVPGEGERELFVDLVGLTMASTQSLFDFATDGNAIPTPTEQSVIERQGHAAIQDTMRAAAVVNGAVTLGALTLESGEQAAAASQSLTDKCETLMATGFDSEVIEALAGLKSAVVKHFTQAAASLPRTAAHAPSYTGPALAIASVVYGSGEGAEDLIRRNKIRHPAFVAAGVSLEVLRGKA